MTLPNALTILRLISAPFILFLLFKGWSEYALMASVLASLTDFFDGKLARALNQESYLGALLDPVADKFFEIILLYFFWTTYDGVLVAYYYFIFVLRNIAQLMSIPILMWWKKIQFKVEPNLTAKLASTWSLLIINLMIIREIIGKEEPYSGFALLCLVYISLCFEIIMLTTYLPRFLQIYQGKHDTFN